MQPILKEKPPDFLRGGRSGICRALKQKSRNGVNTPNYKTGGDQSIFTGSAAAFFSLLSSIKWLCAENGFCFFISGDL